MKSVLSLLAVIFLSVTSFAQQLLSDKIDVLPGSSVYLTNCVVYLPAGYDKTKAYPLVVYSHGMGEAGTDINKLYTNGLPKVLKGGYRPSFDFIMVAPQRASYSVDPKWLVGILEESHKRWRLDSSRIYLTGVSAGGWSAYGSQLNVTAELGKQFAAIVALSCATQDALKANLDWWKTAKTPVWAVVGDADVSYREQNKYMVSEINKRVSGLATLTIRSGVGHTGWNEVYSGVVKNGTQTMWEWLYQFSRTGTGSTATNTTTTAAAATTTTTTSTSTATPTATTTTTTSTSTTTTSTTTATSTTAATSPAPFALKREAESYSSQSGTNTGSNAYISPSKYVYNLHAGDWLDYQIQVPEAGTYTLTYRVLSKSGTNHMQLLSGSKILHTLNIPNSMYWNQWKTISISVYLNAGSQTLRFKALNDDWIIDYWELKK